MLRKISVIELNKISLLLPKIKILQSMFRFWYMDYGILYYTNCPQKDIFEMLKNQIKKETLLWHL